MRQNQEETEDIIDLGVLLKALLRRWWVILLTTILCGGMALIGSILLIAPTYSSGFTAYIDNSKERVTDSISSTDISASKELVSTYSAIIRSRSVVEDAIQKANISCTYEYMEDKVIVQEVDDTGIIEVSVVTEDSKMSYEMAKALGHTITDIKPSLVPLECYEKEECKKLQGLSLKNVKVKLVDKEKNKVIYEDFGEMLLTHFGVSGPIILSSSAHLVRYPKIEEKYQKKEILLKIDFKPALTVEKLDERIRRDFEGYKNKEFKNSLDKLLPQKLIPIIIQRSGISAEKKVNEITKEERKKLGEILKNFEMTIKGTRPIEEAIITSGGINIKEINPKTMESKLVKNLYFAGEIIDVDSYTGGFNLQIAYSTGYTAGM